MPRALNSAKTKDYEKRVREIEPEEPYFFHPSELVPPPSPKQKQRDNNWMKCDGPCFFEHQYPVTGPQLPPLKPFR